MLRVTTRRGWSYRSRSRNRTLPRLGIRRCHRVSLYLGVLRDTRYSRSWRIVLSDGGRLRPGSIKPPPCTAWRVALVV